MRQALILLLLIAAVSQSTAQSIVPERANPRIRVAPVVPMQAWAFNLKDVRLLPGSPFSRAMQKDAAYLLLLDEKRLLHRFYLNAGLPTRGEVYGGWETMGLSGHTLGHYLSACALQWASTGDARFRKKVELIVSELARCQAARKTGYVGAIPDEDSIFGRLARGEIKSSGFDLNGGWSPWYTVHKLMAGLVDAYLYCGNSQALQIVSAMADWTEKTISGLSEAQLQKMLRCEYGGMNDVLANLYSITGQKKYFSLSYRFHDDFVMDSLAKQVDPMPGKHSNTNVPKAIGAARQYELNGDPSDSTIAAFFWSTMVHHHSYVIGGNSNYEYCGEPDQLNDRLSDNTCETCNTYNMLKLTRHLFGWRPSATFADYYERALYNHILASQHPETGMMCYFVPLRMGTKKVFSDSFNTFTCCVGSGMENHSKYAEAIYAESRDTGVYVNLFIPSLLNWKSRGWQLRMETAFPESNLVRIRLQGKQAAFFRLRLRLPGWSGQAYRLRLNGRPLAPTATENGYLLLARRWQPGDQLEYEPNMQLHTESMPDNPDRVAFLYGPLVLAGQLGDTIPDPVYGVPVVRTANRQAEEWIKPVAGHPLQFKAVQAMQPFDVTFQPFYQTWKNYYSVYWDYFTAEQWQAKQEEYREEKRRQKDLEDRSIDFFRIGEMQPERDHHLMASEKSYVSDAMGINGREARAGNYFAFDMKVEPAQGRGNSLVLTYIGDDKDRKFDILVNGRLIATEDWKGGQTGRFYQRAYPLPGELIEHFAVITVRIEANYGRTAGRVFGARTVRD